MDGIDRRERSTSSNYVDYITDSQLTNEYDIISPTKEFNEKKLSYIFLFVNPKSGSGVGSNIIQIAQISGKEVIDSIYEYQVENDLGLMVLIIDITNSESFESGTNLLKKRLDQQGIIPFK